MMQPDARWVYAAVILGAVARIGTLILAGQLGWDSGIEVGVTFFTGFWYAVRYHYTREIGAQRSGTLGKLATGVIGVLGLIAYFMAGTRGWFVGIALVLASGVLKDVEIVITQHNLRKTLTRPHSHKKWRSRLIEMHHWYSMVRDASMSMWWLVFGILIHKVAQADTTLVRCLFAVPYTLLVLAWCCIKEETHEAEESLWARAPIAQRPPKPTNQGADSKRAKPPQP